MVEKMSYGDMRAECAKMLSKKILFKNREHEGFGAQLNKFPNNILKLFLHGWKMTQFTTT